MGFWRLAKLRRGVAPLGRLRLWTICWAPCFAIGAGLAANMLLDTSAPVRHDAVYLGRHAAQKGPSRVRYSSWREPQGEERLTCNASRGAELCPTLAPGQAVVVTAHPGALGWEWVERVGPR